MASPTRWTLERLDLRCPEGHVLSIEGPDAHEVCQPSLPRNVEREYVPGEVFMHISTIMLPMHCSECEEAKRRSEPIRPPPRLTLIRGGG